MLEQVWSGKYYPTVNQRRNRRRVLAVEELEQRLALTNMAYYFSPTGNDATGNGSCQSPWQTINKANSVQYGPGDSINFQSGATFDGNLQLSSSGSPGNPIHIRSYDPAPSCPNSAARATIQGPTMSEGITIRNAGWVEIHDLEVAGMQPIAQHYENNGISFRNETGTPNNTCQTTYSHLQVYRTHIHGFGKYGVGVEVINGTCAMPYAFDDIQIYNSELEGNLTGGVHTVSKYDVHNIHGVRIHDLDVHDNPGFPSTDCRNNGEGIGYGMTIGAVSGAGTPETRVYRNVVHDNGGGIPQTDVTCVTSTQGQPNGGIGIFLYEVDGGVIVEHNESHHNHDGTGYDGGGFDVDVGSSSVLLQHNYSHDNEGYAFAAIQVHCPDCNYSPFYGNTFRYNISENDVRGVWQNLFNYGAINISGDHDLPPQGAHASAFYNNTIYMSPVTFSDTTYLPTLVYIDSNNAFSSPAQVVVANNIFYSAAPGTMTSTFVRAATGPASNQLLFNGNDYYSTNGTFSVIWGEGQYNSLDSWRTPTNQEVWPDGALIGTTVDPQLAQPGGAGTVDGATLEAYMLTYYALRTGSPMASAGQDLSLWFGLNVGSFDFFGRTLHSPFSIGAYQQ